MMSTAPTEGVLLESRTAPKPASGFVNAPRIHTALTANVEKRFLIWMARHTPQAIHSDHLTTVGFLAQLLAGAAYAWSYHNARLLWVVNLFLFFNWLGDSLDGTLARVRNRQRPRYGFYVDHMVDTFGALALMTGLACSGYLHWPIAAAMLAGYYILSIESFLATYTIGRFHLSHGLFGPTEIRILLVVGNAFFVTHPHAVVAGRSYLLFDVGGVVAIAGMAIMAVVAAVRHTVALYRGEKLR
jgi:phosphatidylglycerophosphate synthase